MLVPLVTAAEIGPIEFQNQQALQNKVSLSRHLMGDHIMSLDPWEHLIN